MTNTILTFTIAAALVGIPATGLAQNQITCPTQSPVPLTCYSGQSSGGAFYLMAMPQNWNGSLVLYHRGGPNQAPASPVTFTQLGGGAKHNVLLLEGYALATESDHDGGVAVKADAADLEEVRRIFVQKFGLPKRTYLIGESWGGLVAAMMAEQYGLAADGTRNYDGVLIEAGILALPAAITYALDVRMVYQYYCKNLPLPSEPQYPLYLGLAPGTKVIGAGAAAENLVAARVDDCTGAFTDPGDRTPAQQQTLNQILRVTHTTEDSFSTQIFVGTILATDLVQGHLGGKSPYTNLNVNYSGSDDDGGLNAGIARYAADPAAVAAFAADAGLTGKIAIPVLTLHTEVDEAAIVEVESAYQQAVENAGARDYLFQAYSGVKGHDEFTVSEIQAAFHLLTRWVEQGTKPASGQEVLATCRQWSPFYLAEDPPACRFAPNFKPNSIDTIVYPRSQ